MMGVPTTPQPPEDDLSADELLAFIMQSAQSQGLFGAQEEEEETLLGGFPLDFPDSQPRLSSTETIPVTQRRYGSRTITVSSDVDRYFEYDQWALFSTKSPEYIVGLQNQMIQAGLADGSNLVPGYWGAADADAMRQLLIEANAGQMSWEDALGRRIQFGGPESQAGPRFVMPTYMAPDYATLSQAVKSTFASLVGRDPKDYELALLADQLASDSKAEYNAQVSGQLAEFNAANPATSGAGAEPLELNQGPPVLGIGLPPARQVGGGDTSPRIVGGATVSAVDPMARLREAIAARYSGEIEGEENENEMGFNLQLLQQNLAGLSGAVG